MNATRLVLQAGAGALVVTAAVAGGATHPSIGSAPARVIGQIDFRAAVASPANRAASAGARHAALPHLLPDGAPRADLAHLPRPPANLAVAGRETGIGSVSGFTGITEGENLAATGGELEPPDQGLAAGDGIVGEIVNNTVQFFKSGVPLTAPLNNAVFFNAGTVAGLSDPHIVYDASVHRWFADELTYGGPLGYGFFLAVSQTNDPTGSWNVFFVPSASSDLKGCGKAGCLPDYPQVGFDANGFYITADLFGPKRFVSAAIYAIPKGLLVTGKQGNVLRFTVPDFVVQPAVPAGNAPFSLANGGTEFFLTARNIYNGSTKIRLWQVQNTFNIVSDPSSLVAVSTDYKAETCGPTVPSTQPDVIGPYGQSQQATSAPQLDGGYNSFGANIKLAADGTLYGALTTGASDTKGFARDVIAWFHLDPTKHRIADQGYLVPPDGYSISFPDLALQQNGKGYIGFTITSPRKGAVGGYPSTAIAPFLGKSGAGGTITVTGQGGTSDDGFTGYNGQGQPAGVGRWGDYGAATIDVSTGTFWLANEFIPDPNAYPRGTFANWGTFVTSAR